MAFDGMRTEMVGRSVAFAEKFMSRDPLDYGVGR